MTDCKQAVCDRLTMLVAKSMDVEDKTVLKLRIMDILSEFTITKASTEIAVWNGDKNTAMIQRWLISKAVAGCTERTLGYYKASAERILPKIGKNIEEITPPDIQVYFAREISSGKSLTSVDNDKRVMSSLFNYLYREEIIKRNPFLKIDPIRRDKKKKHAFTDMELEKIRAACRTSRETALIEILISTACRVSEVCSMRYDALQDGKMSIIGKGRKQRTVYFNAKALLAVERYMDERKDANPYIFPRGIHIAEWPHEMRTRREALRWYTHPELVGAGEINCSSIESTVREIGKRAGVENTHPHRFRRTCATNALKKGMPIEMVSKMLGHENIATTQIYLDLSEDDLKMYHGKFVN